MNRAVRHLVLALACIAPAAAAVAPAVAAQTLPRTAAERSNFDSTSTNAEVGAFLDSLQLAGAPLAVSQIGRSVYGKPLYLVRVPLDTAGLYGLHDLADQFLDFVQDQVIEVLRHGRRRSQADLIEERGVAGRHQPAAVAAAARR